MPPKPNPSSGALTIDSLNVALQQLRGEIRADFQREIDSLKGIIDRQTKEIDLLKCDVTSVNDSAALTVSAFQAALERQKTEITSTISADIKALRDEISALKAENASLRDAVNNSNSDNNRITNLSGQQHSQTFAAIVRDSVTSALHEQETKNEVVISKVKEDGQDQSFVSDLCRKMDFHPKPTGSTRIGRKSDARHRLLKVSFSTAFDARAFSARFDQVKRQASDDTISAIRVRLSKTKEERAIFSASCKLAFTLNKEAKDAGDNHSFSVRENGEIWKFQKASNGRWERVRDWRAPGGDTAGNE